MYINKLDLKLLSLYPSYQELRIFVTVGKVWGSEERQVLKYETLDKRILHNKGQFASRAWSGPGPAPLPPSTAASKLRNSTFNI